MSTPKTRLDENDFQTPVKKRTVVPNGHILAASKWRGSVIAKKLQGIIHCFLLSGTTLLLHTKSEGLVDLKVQYIEIKRPSGLTAYENQFVHLTGPWRRDQRLSHRRRQA